MLQSMTEKSKKTKDTGSIKAQILYIEKSIKELKLHISRNKKDTSAIRRLVEKTAKVKKLRNKIKETISQTIQNTSINS